MTLDMRGFVEDMTTDDDTDSSVIDRVVYRYSKLGFDLTELPKRKGKNYIPKLPAKGVSALTDEEVTDLQGEFVVMMEYTGEQAALQNIMAKEYANEADKRTRTIKLKTTGTVSEKEDRARTHPKVVVLKEKADVAKGTYSLLQNKYDAFDKARGVCSRDVERRRRDYEGNRREASIRGKKRRRGPARQSELEPGGRRGR